MGTLDDQLAKADKQAAAAREREARAEQPHGGPAGGPPDDRWLRYHATLATRHRASVITLVGTSVALGLGAMFLFGREWTRLAIVCGAAVIPVAGAWLYLALARTRAAAHQRAFLASLPFELGNYLASMRSPRWTARSGYHVVYKPRLDVRWETAPPRDVVERLCTLVRARVAEPVHPALATALPPTAEQPAPLVVDERCASIVVADVHVTDPWAWIRDVVREVLIPLGERTRVAAARVEIERSVEENSGD